MMRIFVCSFLLLCIAACIPRIILASEVGDLPLVEVPAPRSESPRFMLFLSGDGGWASLDKTVAARVSQAGISVIGFNSRKYFWNARTPDASTRDIERVLRHYLQAWHKTEIVLVGYSFGADVLPYIVNHLPPDLRARVANISFVALGRDATWEVHALDWVPGLEVVGEPIEPDLERLPKVPLLCVYGAGEDSLCPTLERNGAVVDTIGKGHRFGGDYDEVADRILAFSRK